MKTVLSLEQRFWSVYLKADLLGKFFGFMVLWTGGAVGGQSQESRVHGAVAHLTVEVLRPASTNTQTAGRFRNTETPPHLKPF